MSFYAGFDFDTKTVHCVLVDEDDASHIRYHPFVLEPNQYAFDRCRSVRDSLPDRTSDFWDDVVACGVERPMGPTSIVGPLLPVMGAILSNLPRSLLVVPLTPSEWRKECGLSGRASKDEVSAYVHGLLEAGADLVQDAADAACCALATQRKVERSTQPVHNPVEISN